MPFIPHTDDDIKQMLNEIGVETIEQLFDEIPAHLKISALSNIPKGMPEMEVARVMQECAQQDKVGLCFIGAGAYEHHIPAAVWDIVSRGEFYTSYTPYQAEASQGTLQMLYEFQTMIANLTGMQVANATLYEGASAVAEAVLMATRLSPQKKNKVILMPKTLNPSYRKVITAITYLQGIQLEEIPYSAVGNIMLDQLERWEGKEIVALIIPQPNFFGALEEVDQLTDWAHQQNALVIAVVNPIAVALLKEPGSWGKNGADIACGEGQPLGVPLSSGGPYLGFMSCKQEFVRQMPGRIVGRTIDLDGNEAFTLTLQAREQHIRRSKATSNICTSQSLLAAAATIYMSLLGPEGLRRVAATSHYNATLLLQKLTKIKGVTRVFSGPFLNEFVLQLDQPVNEILQALADHGIQGGYNLTTDYPELGQALLVCATETKLQKDLEEYQRKLIPILEAVAVKKNNSSMAV